MAYQAHCWVKILHKSLIMTEYKSLDCSNKEDKQQRSKRYNDKTRQIFNF